MTVVHRVHYGPLYDSPNITLPIFQVLARLSVEEEEHKQKFKMKTTLSGGPLRIRVMDNTTDSFVQSIECHLSSLLYDLTDLPGITIDIDSGNINLITEGTTYFRFGIGTVEDAQEI